MGVALLVAILAAGIVAISASVVIFKLERQEKSERLREYNFAVENYRAAIRLYREKYNKFPDRLEDLLENDDEIAFIRRLYKDPISGLPFGTRRAIGGGIEDVYSEKTAEISQDF